MNLLSITLEYLEKDEANGLTFLKDLVKNAGMSRSLIKHIVACRNESMESKVRFIGNFDVFDDKRSKEVGENVYGDVNIYIVELHNKR